MKKREGEYIHTPFKLILNQLNLFGWEQSKYKQQSGIKVYLRADGNVSNDSFRRFGG